MFLEVKLPFFASLWHLFISIHAGLVCFHFLYSFMHAYLCFRNILALGSAFLNVYKNSYNYFSLGMLASGTCMVDQEYLMMKMFILHDSS